MGDKGFTYHVNAEVDLFTMRLKEHAEEVLQKAGELSMTRSSLYSLYYKLYTFVTFRCNDVLQIISEHLTRRFCC